MADKNGSYLYTPEDLEVAARAMLAQLASDSSVKDSQTANVRAAAAMLHSLAAASGGAVIKGCCTQGCCDSAVLKMIEDV